MAAAAMALTSGQSTPSTVASTNGGYCMPQYQQGSSYGTGPTQQSAAQHSSGHHMANNYANGGQAGPKGGANQATTQSSVHLSPGDVIAAVVSLYDDQLKPFGRILRKRVAERAAAFGSHKGTAVAAGVVTPAKSGAAGDNASSTLPNVDMKQLRIVCNRCRDLRVEEEEGGDWSVLLVNRMQNFIDVYDHNDSYPADLWEEMSTYFASIAGTQQQFLPGGRYSCAQTLVGRELPFLKTLSLGQVCHVVQLAISQKRILGYLNGAVVPYTCSQSMMKEQRAEWQLPYVKPNTDSQELPFATIHDAKRCLKAILETEAKPSYTWGGGRNNGTNYAAVPLSNIKRLFRSRFHLELSETMLGYSKLSELLQDTEFQDVCDVKLIGHGYIVLPKPGLFKYHDKLQHDHRQGDWRNGSNPVLPPGLGHGNSGRQVASVDYIDELQGQGHNDILPQPMWEGGSPMQPQIRLPTLLSAPEPPCKMGGMSPVIRQPEPQKFGSPASNAAELEAMNYIQQQQALFRQHQQRLQQQNAQYQQQQLQLQQQQHARVHQLMQLPQPGACMAAQQQGATGPTFSVPNWTPSPVQHPQTCDAAVLQLVDAPTTRSNGSSSNSNNSNMSPTIFRVQDAFIGENRRLVEPGPQGLPR
eukprot:TRINITY_DN10723_c0_g1_i4.p1 TRINITY_DN10723_c0_g1~~TRINITY_DN10723_c0_g1_i4.p1  ORF type:complete len:675 (-),score=154.50 TRINITY_DN10723_c0_g1_i4:614-2536(-)